MVPQLRCGLAANRLLPVLRSTARPARCSSSSSTADPGATTERPDTDYHHDEPPSDWRRRRERREQVAAVFSGVAGRYDLMNDLMSWGLHRAWRRRQLVGRLLRPTAAPTRLLDMAGGTGELAFAVLDHLHQADLERVHAAEAADTEPWAACRGAAGSEPDTAEERSPLITVCDINQAMLDVGRARALRRPRAAWERRLLEWVWGDAERLDPTRFPDDSYDAYTIAFGLRNCPDMAAVLRGALRVLRPGGRFLCLEFCPRLVPPPSLPHQPSPGPLQLAGRRVLEPLYAAYLDQALPLLGQLVAADWASYRYLADSIAAHPDQAHLGRLMRRCGFAHVAWTDLSLGVCTVHSGFKL